MIIRKIPGMFRVLSLLFILACILSRSSWAAPPESAASASFDISPDASPDTSLPLPLSADQDPGGEKAFLQGERFFDGKGVSQDYEEAARWYLEAAEKGHGIAQYGMATLYERGLGVPEDFEKAVYWYRKAAASSSSAAPQAQAALGMAYEMGIGVSRDFTLAARWFQKASSSDISAKAHLGECYYHGWGVERHSNKAYKLLKEAAVSGDSYAQGLLFRIDPQKFAEYKASYPIFRKLKAKREAFLSFRVVLNSKNSGYGSLRFALNTITNGGTITFAPALSGQIIHLQSPLVIEKSVTISGPGGGTILSGEKERRIFSILHTAVVTLENLHLVQGRAKETGGGLLNDGTLIMTDCVISHCEATHGGGLWNNGVLAMTHCTLRNNIASGDETSCGGGIGNRRGGTVTLTNCLVGSNTAELGGGIGNGGILSLGDSILENNQALGPEGLGGGIRNAQVLSAKNSSFVDNRALRGGALENAFAATAMLENITVSNNSARHSGGGLANSEGFLMLNASTVTENSAPAGGGLFTGQGGTTRLKNSILAGNHTVPREKERSGWADVYGSFRSLGYNLFGTLPEAWEVLLGETDLRGTPGMPLDPQLTLLDNRNCSVFAGALMEGKTIPSYVPREESPGVDMIPYTSTGCNEAPDMDQCGARRPLPLGGYGDIGARERIPGFDAPLPEPELPVSPEESPES